MILHDVLRAGSAGARLAVCTLALMALYAWAHTPRPNALIEAIKTRTSLLWALAAVAYSPIRAALTLGYPISEEVRMAFDMLAAGIACVALIYMLAAGALERTVPMQRVRRAAWANASIPILFIVGAWLTR